MGTFGCLFRKPVAGGKCVTCSGLTNSREELRKPKFGLLGGNHLRTKITFMLG